MAHKSLLLAASSILGVGIAIATPAAAQQDELSEESLLETIIVTAQRRVEALQSTPLSVQAFSPARLNALDAQDIERLGDLTPNVSIGDGTGRGRSGAQIAIRGVGEARVSPVLDPAVGIYIDDVYYGRPQTAFLRLLDVERVEVLRGPQGTLFGKNAVGGAIRYITVKPTFDEVTGFAEVTAGSRDRYDFEGAINIPLADNFAVRLSGGSLNQDGFLERLSDGVKLGDEQTNSISLRARWQPTEVLDINVGVHYVKSDTDNGPQKLFDYPGAFGETARVGPQTGVGGWNNYWGDTPLAYDVDIPTSLYEVAGESLVSVNETETFSLMGDIGYDISDTTRARLILGYREVDQFSFNDPDDQASARTFFGNTSDEGVDFWSVELQVNGTYVDDRLDWVGGVFYSNEEPFRNDILNFDGRNGPPGPNRWAGHANLADSALQETRSLGIFSQATYAITDIVSFTAGLRYTREKRNFTVSQFVTWDFDLAQQAAALGLPAFNPAGTGAPNLRGPVFDGCSPITTPEGCQSVAPISGGDTYDALTPRVALEVQATPDVMAYASISRGFKAGGVNDTVDDINTPFAPEFVWNYEIGARTEWLDNRLRFNVTGFYMDYSDKQITVSAAPECIRRCTTNVGSGRIMGIEIETLAAITEDLSVYVNYGFLDAQWSEITNPNAGISLDSGFSRAPRHSIAAGLNHSYEFNNGIRLNTALNYSYKGEQESSPQDSTTIVIPAYDLITARISLAAPDDFLGGGVSLSVFCTNCADEEFITGGASWAGSSDNTPFGFKPGTHPAYTNGNESPTGFLPPSIGFVNVGEPRVFGVELRKTF